MDRQIYGGVFAILGGLSVLLGRVVGFERIGFLYPLALGLILLLLPGTGAKAGSRRVAGAWIIMAAVIGGVVTLTGLSWAAAGALWPIGVGVMLILTRTGWLQRAVAPR